MKKVIYIIAIIWIGMAVISSCDKNEGAYYPAPSAFSVTPQTVPSVPKDGGNVELVIAAGNLGWWVESSTAWCKVSKKYGSGDGKVTLTIDKNDSGISRKAEVTVHPTFQQASVQITVHQQ
ncbi:hypothetical protein EII40_03405 [Tannerella forsythia]|uniref:BACON domain-containing protein n=2 Tax=Tannerella forsythia TaxID=28112 RepID=A0A3P1XZN8_TANFO|nr:hypothetical protein EII40_03405 [Tannerella forsythia]